MNYSLSIFPVNRTTLFFRSPSKKNHGTQPQTVVSESNQEEMDTRKEEIIRCKVCGHKITTYREKVNVNGSHHHTFANPNGIIFDIGCYKTASGCLNTGPFTNEFSWFTGYQWRISICASCTTHLGWLFLSANNNSFYGLILDRLIESIE